MSAIALLQLPQSIEQQSINLADYVSANEAAEKLGRNAGGFRRTCREQLAALGVAILAASPASGQMQWYVKRSYDPRLASDGRAAISFAELEQYSGRQRDLALQKLACVKEYRKVINGASPIEPKKAALVERLREQFPKLKISRSGLYEWHLSAYKGIAALVDKRGGHQSQEASAEAWKAFEDLYLHQNQPAVRHCWKIVRRLATENGWRWISYSQCRRQLDAKIPPERQMFSRDPERWRTQYSPAIKQHEESWRAGHRWISDGKVLDLWCSWRNTIIRPILVIWFDWRTRRVVGHFLSAGEDNSAILGAFGNAMRDEANFGGPREVVTDNGKSFSSYIFHGATKQERRSKIAPSVDEDVARGIFAMLGIAAHFAIPFNPNGKSRCERFFGNLASFAREFETFCGISSETKPERLKEILANPAKIPTFAEAETRLVAFINEYNSNADHAMDDLSENGVKLSPNEAFSRWCDTRRVMADPAALDLLLAHWHKPVTVGRNGISLTIGGRTLHYGHVTEALRPFKSPGRKVKRAVNVSYDPAALETVRVYDSQFRFVTIAPMNRVGGVVQGMTKADYTETHRQMAAYRRSLKHQAEYSITSILSTEEQVEEAAMKRQARERREAERAAQPAQMRLIQTSLDGQSTEVRRDERRGDFQPAAMSSPQADPYAALRKNQNLHPTPKPATPRKELDGFALLRKRRFA
jgi:hypothetical protein